MEKGEDIPLEHVQNYMRLQNVLNYIALPLLRKLFMSNWKVKYHSEWKNLDAQRETFANGCGSGLFKDSRKIQKKLLTKGDIENWDLPLLVTAIKCFKSDSSTGQQKSFSTLIETRNQLSHHGGLVIDNDSFEKMWNSTEEALKNLGTLQEDLDKAKMSFVRENRANIDRADKLKVEGNYYVKNKDFKSAVNKYTEAISQPGLPSKELAVLYSNRSFAYLKLGDYYGAKDNAVTASFLNPNWWRGFDRLGQVYLSAEKYEEALMNFEKALQLDPSCKLENERDLCRHMIAKIERREHLDPMNYEQIHSKILNRHDKSPFSKDVLSSLMQRASSTYGALGMCAEGHKYLQGNGVTQSFQMAAAWYAKAAAEGNAEGYYNLALLTKEGKGVKLDVAESIRLLRLAASQDICVDMFGLKMPNIGVVEAEHCIGLCYEEGVGVPLDIEKALDWYMRAIKHGSAPSANNVGIMYNRGSGVPHDLQTAINYYKLASSLKLVRGMENVANAYLQLFDKENARKWFRFAVSKGSLALQSSKQDFLALVGEDLEKPIQEDIFELELIQELKSGPLSHLIVQDLPMANAEKIMKMMTLEDQDVGAMKTSRSSLGLTDPYRVKIITDHRSMLRMMRNEKLVYAKGDAKLLPRPLLDLFTLKPIFFADMDFKEDHIYEGFAIKLTLIEDAITGKPSINNIAEDEKGETQRIFIYNFPQNKETQNSIGFGCKITVVNPYFRLAKDGMPMIRVDDISLMFVHSDTTNKKRCRYCGSENDLTVPCRHCKRSFYCSKQCLKKDATELNHKVVCFKKL